MTANRSPSRNQSALSVPVYQILLSLRRGRMHGYAILQDIERRTTGDVRLAAGTLYAALSRLMKEGWVAEIAPADGKDSRRRTYEVTVAGLDGLRREVERLRRAVGMADELGLVIPNGPGEAS